MSKKRLNALACVNDFFFNYRANDWKPNKWAFKKCVNLQ